MRRFSLAVPLSAILMGGTIVGTIVLSAGSTRASSRSQNVTIRPMMTINQAQHKVQAYVRQYSDPHLVIDEILEFQKNFYAIVRDTSTGHGAFEVLVTKGSGLVFPEYGPAMMWNTKYGVMRGGMMGNRYPGGRMTISAVNAAGRARQWLQQHQRGTTAETPDQFPGYYTVHFHRNGVIAGMFSVNGYTGRVWYHSWHGKFIQIKRVNGGPARFSRTRLDAREVYC